MPTPSRRLEDKGNALFSYILHFMHILVRTLQIVYEIVSTMAANRNPYSQWHVQAKIIRDTAMIRSGGKTPGKMFEDMHSTLV